MDGANDVTTLIAVLGGLVAAVFAGVFVARRARAARQRQLQRMEEARPATDRKAALLRDLAAPPSDEDAEPPGREAEPAADAAGTGEARDASAALPAPAPAPEPGEPPARAADAAPPRATEPSPVRDEASATGPARAPAPSAPERPDGARVEMGAARPSATAVPIERPSARGTPPAPSEAAGAATRSTSQAAFARGLARTRSGWVSRLGKLLSGKKAIAPEMVEEIERALLTADIGVKTATRLLDDVRESLSRKELADAGAVWDFLRARTEQLLSVDAPPLDLSRARPFVLLVVGVNGTGKTTTIGKLAAHLRAQGKSVVLAAGDTFRAAAVEQLEVWASRTNSLVVKGKEGADPSSVIFEGIKRAQAEGIDVVIADTAGRLHTKTDLMDELQKVGRVAGKALPGAPHETWLVLDSTSGQNAIAQAEIFTRAMQVSGIVLTKLDGTAKGGVILGISDQLKIPVRYVGVGEGVEDLREFVAADFVAALFDREGAERDAGAAA